ncbi:MAG TPA: 1-(5-phosphoribosyl)-5-[(5-phosphoribosylamino)methylideneamino]imidazole-4-carboxamide isomerase [Spirochaetota bacterium]|jgi:phosphoribosylformimino-5-aminoimidazole carboxamide ribotide isomerase|nr:MAG: 1-(5-phosphoribosyl)-5-((5-phosphoribosylamino)methylideneamino) imidazole-4-carboxamide isomerase [Spirochaetes bacterium ADurb.Bin133]HNZ26027.1 1-(5-phosphoribosyl)-5-[(5-phosphoribosylamino)methylideneamino]imidazole-4-carboxamide isomerase [Spirochaetota bacterium]HOF00554.1 1-(5-phosphoribosyl)-5-[(5-phosphoribosylamino)methylideneamino]imidazole-4-carboxamide isomerase [Spirochaetota bacterium]HOS32578.1 1-(5-phosphoribosyl)-5-[(5-phosphoribosylamino)methylideneamino]imidazole-4-c
MLIIPAIDLIDGKCVRLTEGDYNQKKIYDNDPIKIARIFKNMGAKRLHVIDLDGAKTGSPINRNIVKAIKKETGLSIEFGGGIRTEEDIKSLLYEGIDKIILGTVLVNNPDLAFQWVNNYPDNFIAAVDVKNNSIQTQGWLKNEKIDSIEFGKNLFQNGFKIAIYTDISRDGRLAGPNIEATKMFSNKTGLHVILSGGVSSEEDIKSAKTLIYFGLIGIIVGKAYYENKLDLKEIIKKYQR